MLRRNSIQKKMQRYSIAIVFLFAGLFPFKLGFNINILSSEAIAQILKGEIVSNYANQSIIYDWFYYVPQSITKDKRHNILLIAEGGGFDYTENSSVTKSIVGGWSQFAEDNGIIIVGASIPRGFDDLGIHHYVVAIPISSFDNDTDELYRHPDEKVNQMTDQLSGALAQEGYSIDNRILIYGFSNEAMFANRYALLHPERVRAIAVGQCGGYFTMPIAIYNSTNLQWAIGTYDFKALSGKDFNNEKYTKVSHFNFIGDQDTENSHFYADEDFWTQSQIDFINSNFGYTDPVRLQNQSSYLKGLGYDITFQLYAGVDHSFSEEWWNDARNFLISHKSNRGDGKPYVYYKDFDNDSFGNSSISIKTTTNPVGYVADNTDCDDTNSNIFPGASEIFNQKDDNCDGQIDEGHEGKRVIGAIVILLEN